MQHEPSGELLGRRADGELLLPASRKSWSTAGTTPPASKRRRASSSTSRRSTTASDGTGHWGTSPRPSTSGRTTKPTAKDCPRFVGNSSATEQRQAYGREAAGHLGPGLGGDGVGVRLGAPGGLRSDDLRLRSARAATGSYFTAKRTTRQRWADLAQDPRYATTRIVPTPINVGSPGRLDPLSGRRGRVKCCGGRIRTW